MRRALLAVLLAFVFSVFGFADLATANGNVPSKTEEQVLVEVFSRGYFNNIAFRASGGGITLADLQNGGGNVIRCSISTDTCENMYFGWEEESPGVFVSTSSLNINHELNQARYFGLALAKPYEFKITTQYAKPFNGSNTEFTLRYTIGSAATSK